MHTSKRSIRPTVHYLKYHSDVDWELVVLTLLSPTKTQKQRIANRYEVVRAFKKKVVTLHVERDDKQNAIWVINAFVRNR